MIDVAAGDKIPRKGGPGITKSDLLVINKIDLAPHVGASLEVMDRDAKEMRGERPFVFTNLKTGQGLDQRDRLHRAPGPVAVDDRRRSHGQTEHDMTVEEHVVLVDANDNALGEMEKLAAHADGVLHRAFSAYVVRERDGEAQLLLQRRATAKYHFGGLWTNTCCGHPLRGEAPADAGRRRLAQEMNFSCELVPVGAFTYQRAPPTACASTSTITCYSVTSIAKRRRRTRAKSMICVGFPSPRRPRASPAARDLHALVRSGIHVN